MKKQYTEKEIPDFYRAVFKKAYSGKSKAAALKAKCIECSCFQKVEVRNCTVKSCPLWGYRPYQVESEQDDAVVE